MADTNIIRAKVEPFVCDWLRRKFGVSFSREKLLLKECESNHQFDAVSEDRRIVACIRSASGNTSGQNSPSGKLAGAFKDLYYLLLVEADIKVLVLTDSEFHEYFERGQRKNIPSSIQVLHCALPAEIEQSVRAMRKSATEEIDRGKPKT
jgi:hypothetical protein